MTLALLTDLLAETAALHAGRPALVPTDGPSVTHADLVRRAAAVSRALGPSAGEVVGLLSANRPEWAVAFFGISGSGAAVLPLDPHLTHAELAHLLAEFGCRRVLSDRPLEGLAVSVLPLEPSGDGGGGVLPRPAPSAMAVLLASSGTTGKPKGVMLSHANILANVSQFRRRVDLGPSDAFLALLPQHHVFPLLGTLLAPVACGGAAVYPDGMRPAAVVEAVRKGGATFALVVPGILRLLSKTLLRGGGAAAVLGDRFRAMIVGGAPCPLGVLQEAGHAGLLVLQGYGMSEASPVIAVNTFGANRLGTVGRPVTDLEVRINGDAEGEILVKGPNVMMGYFGDPERTSEVLKGGWLHTGDIGSLDADGYLAIRGRAKNVIISESGKNVYPEEIEAEIAKSPLVKECCVVGRDVEGSERVAAVVVPHDDARGADLKAEVLSRCAALAEYKRPHEVVVWTQDLPKTATGKVKSAAVREALRGKDAARG